MFRKSSISLKQRVLSAVMGSIMLLTSVTPAMASTVAMTPTAGGEAISTTESPVTLTGRDFNTLVKDYVAGTDDATVDTLDTEIQKIIWSEDRPEEGEEVIKISETGDIFAWYKTADELKAEAEGEESKVQEDEESSNLVSPDTESSSPADNSNTESNTSGSESSANTNVEESSNSSNPAANESSAAEQTENDSTSSSIPATEESSTAAESSKTSDSSQVSTPTTNSNKSSSESSQQKENQVSSLSINDEESTEAPTDENSSEESSSNQNESSLLQNISSQIAEPIPSESSPAPVQDPVEVSVPVTGSEDEEKYKNTLFVYSYAFENDLPIHLNADSSYMFAGMTALEDVSFLNYMDASKVQKIDFMFAGNIKLKDVSPLQSFDTTSLTSAKSLFLGAEKLEAVNMAPGEYKNKETDKTYNAWMPGAIVNGKDAFEGTKVTEFPVWYNDYLIALQNGTFVDPEDDGSIKETEEEVNVEDVEKFNAARTNENYILEKADPNLVNATKAEIVNVLKVKQTLFDGTITGPNETIDSIMQTESAAEKLITMLIGAVPVYNVDDESDYYVAYADTMLHDSSTFVQDYITAEDNTNGIVVENTIYDKASGLLYIPKDAYVDEDNTFIVGRIQIQLMQIVNNFDDTNTLLPVTVNKNGTETPSAVSKDILSLTTKIPVVTAEEASSYDKSNLLVIMNGMALSDNEYTFNEDGSITIDYSPAAITNVSVTVDEPSVIEELLKAMSSPVHAADYTESTMGFVKQSSTMVIPASVKEGDVFTGMLHYKYQQGSDYGNAYTFEKGNLINSAQEEVVELLDQGGVLADDQIFALQDTGLNFEADLPASSFSNGDVTLDFSSVAENITLQCAHVSVSTELGSADGADDYWYTRTGKIRVLRLNYEEGYALFGVLTMRTNTQNGYGIIKLAIEEELTEATFNVEKQSSNITITAKDSHYSLSGAVYKLYRDAGCTQEYAVLTTGSNGKTPQITVEDGTYYLREEKAPTGYTKSTTVYTITLKAGDSVNYVVKNTPYNKGSVKIYKYDDLHNEPLDDAEFTLYKWSNATSSWTSMGLLNSLGSGYYGSNTLYADGDNPSGQFKVVETKIPEGYTGSFEHEFSLNASGTVVELNVPNTPLPYLVYVNKFDTGIPEDKLSDAEFTIVPWDPSTSDYTDPATTGMKMTWDAANERYYAEVLANNINRGFFMIVETQAPAGYAGGYSRKFDVSQLSKADPSGVYAGIITLDVGNDILSEQGKVQVKKTATGSATALEGAVFKVYEYNARTASYNTTPIDTLKYNSATGFYESTVPLYRYDRAADAKQNDGKYKVVEELSPAGYINEGWSKEFTVVGNDDFTTVQLFDYAVTNTPNEFIIQKYSGNTSVGIEGVQFRFTNTGTGIRETLTTNASGKITLSCLAPGTYQFYELSAPDGYEIDPNVYSFIVEMDGTINDQNTYTQIVRNYPFQSLSITKKNVNATAFPDPTSEFPKGTEFTIYEYSVAESKYKEEAYCKAIYSNGIFVDPDTNALPMLKVNDENGGKYKVVETKATPGFTLDPENLPTKEITLSTKASTDPIEISFDNTSVVIDGMKVDQDGQPLANAIFEIWKDGDLNTIKYATTGEDGKFYFTGLDEGTWYLRENRVPYGYALEPTIYQFTVENGMIDGKSIIIKTFENAKKYWLDIVKTNSETGAVLGAGTEFDLYEWSEKLGDYVSTPSMHIIHKDTPVTVPVTGREEDNPLIAVIDTGVHEESAGIKINGIYSVLGDDGIDFNGHGTGIIETILAHNPDANIISIKAVGPDGSAKAEDIVEAIELAIEEGASIINLSSIGKVSEQNNIVSDTIKYATSFGITVVVAAGNQNDDAKNYVGANVEEAIVVASCDEDGAPSYKSNYGETVDVAVSAPSTSYAAACVTGWLSLNVDGELTEVFHEPTKKATDDSSTITIGEDLYIQSTLIFFSKYPDGATSTGGVADQYGYPNNTAYTFQYPGGKSTCTGTTTVTTSFNANGGSSNPPSKTSTVTNTWTFSYWSCWIEWNNSGLSQGWYTYYVGNRIALGANGYCEAYGVWTGPSPSGGPLTLPSCSRTGYTCTNWSNGSGANVGAPGATYYPTSSGTLYAQWKANSYTIAYNANGGSGSMSTTSATYDTYVTLRSNGFGRTGYTFAGWNTNAAGTGTNYANGASVRNLTATNGGTVTLYAKWTPNKYTVTYNANGGTGSMSNSTATYNTAFTTRQNAFSRSGYSFNGWNEAANGSGTAWTLGSAGVYESGKSWNWTYNKNITLYAQWKANTYTNTIAHWRWVGTGGNNAAGNQYNDGTTTTFTGTYGQSVTIPSDKIRTFTGYHNTGVAGSSSFGTSGWGSKAIGSTFTQPASGIYIEYYYDPNTYTIKYNGNGSTGGSTNNTSATYDQNVTLESNGFTRTGYTFNGWNTNAAGTGTNYSAGQTLTKPNFTSTNGGTYNLYAKWSANTYTIKYNANGGSGTMADTAATYDQNVTLRSNAFSKEGHTFNGWNTVDNGSGTSYANAASVKNLTATDGGTANLYAQWKINTYTQRIFVRYEMFDTYDTYLTDYELVYNQNHDWNSTLTYNIPGTDTHEPLNYSLKVTQANDIYLTVLLINPGRDLTYIDAATGEAPVLYETDDNLGKYKLVETKQIDGYILDDTPIYFTMNDANSENVVTLDIENDPNHYYIKKVDKNNQPLEGATFSVWHEDTPSNKTSYTTGTDGTIDLSTLKPGTWYLQETAAPSGYSAYPAIFHFVINKDGTLEGSNTVTISNVRNDDPIFIIRKINSNGTAVPNVDFTITYPDGSSSIQTTTTAGLIIIEDLVDGTYYYQEVSPQQDLVDQGLILDTTRYSFTVSGTTITQGNGTVSPYATITNDLNSFTITKQSTNGLLLDGAVFEVWNHNTPNDKTQYTTSEGKITFSGLKPGTWYYQEVIAPTGYVADTSIHSFTVASDATINGSSTGNATITNRPIELTIQKVDAASDEAIAGVTFRVWIPGDPDHTGTYTTNSSGKIVLSGLIPGTYYYKEISAPSGYYFDEASSYFIVAENGTISGPNVVTSGSAISITVENTKNELLIQKNDAEGNPLSGVKFTIAGTTYTTNASGQISLKGLDAGSYTITEKSTLNGYIMLPSPISFEVTDNGEITSAYSGFSSDEGKGTFTITNNRYTVGRLIIKKYDSTTGKIIPTRDAVFRLYEWNGSDYFITSKKSTATADGTYVIENIYMTAGNMGRFKVVEESAPNGYLSSYESEFTLSGTNTTQEITLIAGNRPNSYTIVKHTETGDALKGITFKVWKTGEEDKATTLVTDQDGLINIPALTTGEWNYQEIATKDGYMLDMRIHKFTVADDHTINGVNDFVAAPFVNYEYKPYYATVELTKTDNAGGHIDEAEFAVYAYSAETDEFKKSPYAFLEYDSDSKTYKTRTNLHWTEDNQGRFLVKETKSKTGYAADFSEEIQIVLGGNLHQAFALSAVNYPNEVQITKTDENGAALAGATFRIETVLDESTLTAAEMESLFWFDTADTDANGYASFSKLKPGDYKIFEVKAPSGYTVDYTSYDFTVGSDGMIIPKDSAIPVRIFEIEAVNKQNEVIIHKVNSSGVNLSGATFYIYSDDVADTYTLTTDTTGKITLRGLPDGKWYFKETVAPTGYQLNESVYSFIVYDGGILELDVALPFQSKTFKVMNLKNGETLTGDVFVQKLSSVDNKPLQGVGFSVFEFDGSLQQYKQIASNSLTYDSTLQMYKLTGLEVTTENEGKFMIAETTTPDGYAGTWKAEINLTEKNLWQFIGETAVYNDLNEFTIEKLDSVTSAPLKGVEFKVFVEGLDEGTPIAQDVNGNTITNHQTLTTDENGHIVLRGLKNDTTYYYQETKTREGYLIDKTIRNVIVQDNGTIYGKPKHTVQVFNTFVMVVPSLHTGGPGRTAIYFTGWSLLTYSILGTVYNERKKKKRRAS